MTILRTPNNNTTSRATDQDLYLYFGKMLATFNERQQREKDQRIKEFTP